MGLEINRLQDRTYSKVTSVDYSGGVANINVKNTHNRLEEPVVYSVFTFNVATEPTIAEGYELIKTLPEFEGFYNC